MLLAGLGVDLVLQKSVVAAHLWVVRSWEEFATHLVLGRVDSLATTVLRLLPWERCLWRWRVWLLGSLAWGLSGCGWRKGASWWSDLLSLVVTVAASDDDLELFLRRACVRRHRGIDARAPQGALERSHGWRVGAILSPDSLVARVVGGVIVSWVERRVTLRKDVL